MIGGIQGLGTRIGIRRKGVDVRVRGEGVEMMGGHGECIAGGERMLQLLRL